MNILRKLIPVLLLCGTYQAQANTITVVTKGAGQFGASFLSASHDSFKADPSLVYIKGKKFSEGAKRNVYPDADLTGEDKELFSTYSPRLNAPERSELYYYGDKPLTKRVGEIDEISKTFAYLDAQSGVLNEHGVMIATSRAYVRNFKKVSYKNGGILNVSELSRIALERCENATDSIKTIGSLIEEYGVYGVPYIICVADKDTAYTMEILPLEDDKKGLWIAKRISDGCVYISADSFRIDDIDENDDTLIMQPGLIQKLYDRKIAKTNSNKKLSWIHSIRACEKRPYYSLRRIWRASCILNANCKLSAWSESYLKNNYPFEIIPDRKVSAEFLMQLHRDTFKGTEFDPSATPSGGFFASPYSYNLENERAISTTSTAYTYINEVSSDLPVPICHFALNTPAESVFIPLTVSELPDAYSKVDRNRYDETKLYWATNMVSTLTKGYYYTMIDTVKVKALELEQKSKATISQYSKLSAKDFTSLLNANAIASITGINSLYQLLLEHHDNGYKLRYAQGHNPKFIPVERYNKEENLRKAKQND